MEDTNIESFISFLGLSNEHAVKILKEVLRQGTLQWKGKGESPMIALRHAYKLHHMEEGQCSISIEELNQLLDDITVEFTLSLSQRMLITKLHKTLNAENQSSFGKYCNELRVCICGLE